MTRPIDITEVAQGLTQNIERLARELLPLGRREGDEWVEASRGHGGLGDSLKVKIGGARRGVWGHFAANARGDALDLVAYLMFDGAKAPP